MLRWIIKTLWLQKASVLISSTGVAVAFVLMVIMDASFVGESRKVIAYIEHSNADVWVMQRGVSNMHMANSFVWEWKVDRIRTVPGVKQATPILAVNAVIKTGGVNRFTYIIGLTADGQRAGPWAMVSGQSHPRKGEIILPQVIADMGDIQLGDQISIANRHFRIVGLSAETFSMTHPFAFAEITDMQELSAAKGTVSYVLVDAEEGEDPVILAKRIQDSVDKINAIPEQQFLKNDYQIGILMGAELISIMTIVGTVLAALIIAFTAYSQFARRRRELAIIKALGFTNKTLYLAVIVQTFIITTLSLALAFLITSILVPTLTATVPIINLEVTGNVLLRMSVIAFIVALVAALMPARFVAKVDPITAFKV